MLKLLHDDVYYIYSLCIQTRHIDTTRKTHKDTCCCTRQGDFVIRVLALWVGLPTCCHSSLPLLWGRLGDGLTQKTPAVDPFTINFGALDALPGLFSSVVLHAFLLEI